jgi:hypothetical protein
MIRIIRSVKLNATIVATVYLTAHILSGSVSALPEMLLFVKLNVFALPLAAGTSLFDYPVWVWYVTVLLWVLQGMHYAGVSVRDAVRFAVNE